MVAVALNVIEDGENVQVVDAGRPEQANVNVPVMVFVGLKKMVASVVDPSAVVTVGVDPAAGVYKDPELHGTE